ncbi:Na/Pi cotransporter family protein [Granulosicoccus antarcticus]|nr:Na/Pi cotransporter family protein [Granulosicoccus antarcticus]
MLLLFSVRLVRTGIERAHGAAFQKHLVKQTNLISASLSGVGLAVILQSSAAVALLASGFFMSGYLSFSTGLAIVLGGDLGSALVIRILSYSVDWIIAPLLAVGGWCVIKSESKTLRQYGRVIMGIALILISLGYLRQAIEPFRESALLPTIAAYLEQDYVSAFIVGAILTFGMHSSVAAILVVITFVEIDAVTFEAGLSLLVGANFGSGFIPVWLTKGMPGEARRLVFANLFARGILSLFVLSILPILHSYFVGKPEPGSHMLMVGHMVFNATLVLLTLPFCRHIEGIMKKMYPGRQSVKSVKRALIQPVSVLEKGTINTPKLAFTSLKQELLRMLGLVESMFHPVMQIYLDSNDDQVQAIRQKDKEVNACLFGIRSFVASIPTELYNKAESRVASDLLEYAIRLESAGDVVARQITELAVDFRINGYKFSGEGQAELTKMHEEILSNFKLAANVLISNDPENARLLSLEKTEIKRVERQSRKRHLKRLQNGLTESFETSDIHLETLRAFREFNGHVAAIAYPVLYETGQLLETRLITTLPVSSDSVKKQA